MKVVSLFEKPGNLIYSNINGLKNMVCAYNCVVDFEIELAMI